MKTALTQLRAAPSLRRQIVTQERIMLGQKDTPSDHVTAQLSEYLVSEIRSAINSVFFRFVAHLAPLEKGRFGPLVTSMLKRVNFAAGQVVDAAGISPAVMLLARGKLLQIRSTSLPLVSPRVQLVCLHAC